MCNLIRNKLSVRTYIINTVLYSIHNAEEEKSLENEVESGSSISSIISLIVFFQVWFALVWLRLSYDHNN